MQLIVIAFIMNIRFPYFSIFPWNKFFVIIHFMSKPCFPDIARTIAQFRSFLHSTPFSQFYQINERMYRPLTTRSISHWNRWNKMKGEMREKERKCVCVFEKEMWSHIITGMKVKTFNKCEFCIWPLDVACEFI